MLVFSGLGSFFSRKIVAGNEARLRRVLIIVAALVAALAFAAPVVSNAGIVWPLPLKMLVTALIIAPGRIRDGDAVSERPNPHGEVSSAFGSLGLGVKCSLERARLRQRHLPGDLSWLAGNAVGGWNHVHWRMFNSNFFQVQ